MGDSERQKSLAEEEIEPDENVTNFLKETFLDLEKIDECLYRCKSLWKNKFARSAYGGQVIGQALMAASLCAPLDSHLHSMHAYFLRPGKTDVPVLYHVEVTRAGRTYCATSVKATQANQAIFTLQASFKREEQNLSSYQTAMPKVPKPDELSSPEEILDRFKEQEIISGHRYDRGKEWISESAMLFKYVKEEHIAFSASQRQTLWLKVKGKLSDDIHPNIHKCCLSYMSDAYLLRTAIMPLSWLHKTSVFSTSLDHSMWFHAPFKADDWLLFDIEIDSMSDGRALLLGRVWNQTGTLVATIAQEGVLRLPKSVTSKL